MFDCVRLSSFAIVFHIHISISYRSEVNIIIIKAQFDFLHHQEEKALKRLGGGDLSMFKM